MVYNMILNYRIDFPADSYDVYVTHERTIQIQCEKSKQINKLNYNNVRLTEKNGNLLSTTVNA